MASLNEQMDDMLGSSYSEDTTTPKPNFYEKTQRKLDLEDKGKGKVFVDKEDADERLQAFGTGLAVGTAALPSDTISGTSMATDFISKDPVMSTMFPTAANLAPYVKELDKYVGRPAFEEVLKAVGIKSDVTNMNQIAGEIISPIGVFTKAPKAILSTLSDGGKKIYNELFNLFGKGGGTSGGMKLVTEGGDLNNINKIPEVDEITEINKPKIDMNTVGLNTAVGKEAFKTYADLERKAIGGTEGFSLEKYKVLDQEVKNDMFRQTGMYRGEDGRVRYKIDTRTATLNEGFFIDNGMYKQPNDSTLNTVLIENMPEGATVKDILNYEDLYRQYNSNIVGETGSGLKTFQQIKNIKIKPITDLPNATESSLKNTAAAYLAESDTIYIAGGNSPKFVRSSVLHELQHAIQRREGFNTGGSSSKYLEPNYYESVDKLNKQIDTDVSNITDVLNSREKKLNIVVDKDILNSAALKLARREITEMTKGGGIKKGVYIPSDNAVLNFTDTEKELLSVVNHLPEFDNFMQKRVLYLEQQSSNFKKETEAAKKYMSLPGEKEAFKVQDVDNTTRIKNINPREVSHSDLMYGNQNTVGSNLDIKK